MISVGLDLSLARTGVVVLDGDNLVTSGVVKSKPDGDSPKDELDRLVEICTNIEKMVFESDRRVDIISIEGLAFMARNTTALVQLAGLNYFVRKMCVDRGVPFVIVAPTSLKKFISGKGVGDKNIMMLEVYKKYGFTFLDDNENDAFVLAKIGQHISEGVEGSDKPQKEVLALVSKQIIDK